jgi:chromosome segregation ATPase
VIYAEGFLLRKAIARLQTELDSARDRIVQRDNDLNDVESSLKALQSERRQMGDTQSADKAALELEIERVKRDLRDCEDDLERARDDVKYTQERLRAMDLENARMVSRAGFFCSASIMLTMTTRPTSREIWRQSCPRNVKVV